MSNQQLCRSEPRGVSGPIFHVGQRKLLRGVTANDAVGRVASGSAVRDHQRDGELTVASESLKERFVDRRSTHQGEASAANLNRVDTCENKLRAVRRTSAHQGGAINHATEQPRELWL